MDDDEFWADEENEEQVGPGGGLADRAVRGNNVSPKDSCQEDEDEDEDGGNEDEGDEEDEGEGDEGNNGGYWDVTFHGVRHFTKKGNYMLSFDLQNGFYALDIPEQDRGYFTADVCGQLYRLAGLPIARWSLSPF
eukprot:jgi/Tetstr1/429313/TSEL_019231.t1